MVAKSNKTSVETMVTKVTVIIKVNIVMATMVIQANMVTEITMKKVIIEIKETGKNK
jgi:hypothetical protein